MGIWGGDGCCGKRPDLLGPISTNPEILGVKMSETRVEQSPSGKYTLHISLSKKNETHWQFSMARVEDGEKNISVIHRNYPSFPFAWIEGHPDGHDYLICGEDYQGQTIIQLDTGLRKDYLPKIGGFCWIVIDPVEKTQLRVEGCYWAAPEEIVLYDFSNPMEMPYPELDRWFDDLEDDD